MSFIITTADPTTIDLMTRISEALRPPMEGALEAERLQEQLKAHIRGLHEQREIERLAKRKRALKARAELERHLLRCQCGEVAYQAQTYGGVEDVPAECPVHSVTETDEQAAVAAGLTDTAEEYDPFLDAA